MAKYLHTGLSPNAERDDVRLALSVLCKPWSWKKGEAALKLEQQFESVFDRTAISFSSGRACLEAILKVLELEPSDEVLLQAFTCVAVPGPILWAKARPVFVDCTSDLIMDIEDLKRKITPRSKVLIIQHTFGRVADIARLIQIAEEHALFVIEDCAHALGATYQGQPVGSFGDAAFFSFGRDKVISSVFGGMVVARHFEIAGAIRDAQAQLPMPTSAWIAQQLFHPVYMSLVKATYGWFSLGKILAEIGKRFHLISKALVPIEKTSGKPYLAGLQMPNALAILAAHQWAKLERFNTHRRKIAGIYHKGLHSLSDLICEPLDKERIWLRYSIFLEDRDELMRKARAACINLGDWYDVPIAPRGVDQAMVGYIQDHCPTAEHLSKHIINLPTHIGIQPGDAERIVGFIRTVCH